MEYIRTSTAEWKGNLKQGSGHMKVGRGAYEGAFTYASRFETGKGTNPEELIAAAHAGCFSMQFSAYLADAGFTPKSVRTTAGIHIEAGKGITRIDLVTEGEVPGISDEEFQKQAQAARETCPVSQALKAVPMTLKATLLR